MMVLEDEVPTPAASAPSSLCRVAMEQNTERFCSIATRHRPDGAEAAGVGT